MSLQNTYVIAGVSGKTGAAAANALLERGQAVKVLVRDAAKGETWLARGAQVAVLSLDDHAALAAALAGASGAYLINPPDYATPDPVSKARKIGAAFAYAIAESALPHAVVLSSFGAQRAQGTGIIATLHALESELAKVERPISFVRASAFMQNQGSVVELARTQSILPSMLQPLDRAIDMVDTTDIGTFVADLLIAGAKGTRQVIEFTGPRASSPNDAAAILARVYDRDVVAVAPPREQWAGILEQGGMSKEVARLFVEMFDGINSGVVASGGVPSLVRGKTTFETALARDFATVAVAH